MISSSSLVLISCSVEFFTVCTKLAEMAILYSKDLTTAKIKVTSVGLNLVLEISYNFILYFRLFLLNLLMVIYKLTSIF